ncbi:hypothetical protein CICLE_v10018320mg [Citrus x clementina]|uniref:Uncharacterized protein n=2 Tax=Citrus TaxID=2706 RepID=A0A067F1K8_CITSI|nr:hypothetical protein CICLE_v10018320mg [Citrus x clementina]KDO61193.1 hypothetical protein CISIN_1g047438mg [Citrus sinensis]
MYTYWCIFKWDSLTTFIIFLILSSIFAEALEAYTKEEKENSSTCCCITKPPHLREKKSCLDKISRRSIHHQYILLTINTISK